MACQPVADPLMILEGRFLRHDSNVSSHAAVGIPNGRPKNTSSCVADDQVFIAQDKEDAVHVTENNRRKNGLGLNVDNRLGARTGFACSQAVISVTRAAREVVPARTDAVDV
jgi:hypothetical protein